MSGIPEKQCENCQYWKDKLAIAEAVASTSMKQLHEILTISAMVAPSDEHTEQAERMMNLRINFEKDRAFTDEYAELVKKKVAAAKAEGTLPNDC